VLLFWPAEAFFCRLFFRREVKEIQEVKGIKGDGASSRSPALPFLLPS